MELLRCNMCGNSDAKRFKREIMELTGKSTYIAGEAN